jgi:hypothetical protein
MKKWQQTFLSWPHFSEHPFGKLGRVTLLFSFPIPLTSSELEQGLEAEWLWSSHQDFNGMNPFSNLMPWGFKKLNLIVLHITCTYRWPVWTGNHYKDFFFFYFFLTVCGYPSAPSQIFEINVIFLLALQSHLCYTVPLFNVAEF